MSDKGEKKHSEVELEEPAKHEHGAHHRVVRFQDYVVWRYTVPCTGDGECELAYVESVLTYLGCDVRDDDQEHLESRHVFKGVEELDGACADKIVGYAQAAIARADAIRSLKDRVAMHQLLSAIAKPKKPVKKEDLN